MGNIDLRHAFTPCRKTECFGQPEHCGFEWCGAPREHSIHFGHEPADPEKEKSDE